MKIINWEHFEKRVKVFYDKARELQKKNTGSYVSTPLFRGQSNMKWKLETTLDRIGNKFSVKEYNRIIRRIKSNIESCTSERWELSSTEQDIEDGVDKYDKILMASYEYMSYLRHTGFPSPLLDWTRSPYLAAFFAFKEDKNIDPKIFMYMEDTGDGKIYEAPNAKICYMGKNVRTHRRHHLQQSEYTFCVKEISNKQVYVSHEEVFSLERETQDICEKYTLPYSERSFFLNKLNQMNIHSYSLFENEEGLMNKLANEQFIIKNL